MKRQLLTSLALLAGLFQSGWLEAAVECPEMGVILTGTGQQIMGGTYSEHVELEKVSGGPGYNGKWRIKLFKSTTTYTWNVGALSIPTQRVDLGHGLWMSCDTALSGNTAVAICKEGNLELDVVNNRVGYIKTDVWIGKITGDTMTIKFHKENPIEPHITGTIHKVSGGELELRITQPAHEQKFVYSSGSPGELQLDLKAEVTPASLKNSIQWTLPEIAGATRTVVPANATGANLTVTYKGLPQKNTEFGFKEITASVDAGLCEATEKADIAVYFPRDAKNNPGGSEPNWFYYWSQTAARKGPARYGGLSGKCASGADSGGRDGLVGYYRYISRDPVYYICDLGRLPGNFRFDSIKIVTQNPLQIDNQQTTGIDTFAVASHHENAHYEHFKQWWFQFNPNPIRPSGGHMMPSYDSDEDFIPNAEEPAYSLDPNNKYTLQQYNSQINVDDEEWLSTLAETTWQPGNADHVDWARPGKQWP